MTIERIAPLPTQKLDRSNGTDARVVANDRTGWDVIELVKALTVEVTQLEVARDSNRRIGMAMGIVMRQRQVDETLAFDALRRISQNTNRKLRDVAEDVIRARRI
jgi:AmiR/NasT family two-component response regulator